MFIPLQTLFSDFCYDPSSNLLSFFSDTSTSYSIISYYTQCDGLSPFNYTLGNITDYMTTLSNSTSLPSSAPTFCDVTSEVLDGKYMYNLLHFSDIISTNIIVCVALCVYVLFCMCCVCCIVCIVCIVLY